MVIITAEQIQAQKLLKHKQIPRNLVTDLAGTDKQSLLGQTTKVSFFKLGKTLRFGFHGIFGSLALVATSYALCHETNATVNVACLLGAMTAMYASFLLGQVPPASHITDNPVKIVAPHINAFKAAIALIGYCNIRCFQDYFPHPIYYQAAVLAAWWPFVPNFNHLEWDNGNTYLLVLPRFVGVSADTAMVLLGKQSLSRHGLLSVQLFLLAFSFLYSLSFRVHHKAMPFIIYFVTTLGGIGLGLFVVLPEMMN